ncbi:hypothetical protein HPY86_08110 [candidate division WOR-3 bacterium]|nr:hypothetical protein [candidate division WOR-3 bacterium]
MVRDSAREGLSAPPGIMKGGVMFRAMILLLMFFSFVPGQISLDTILDISPLPIWWISHIPVGNKLYIFAYYSGYNAFFIFDCTSRRVLRQIDDIPLGEVPVWCPRYNKVYVIRAPDTLMVFNNANDSIIGVIPTPSVLSEERYTGVYNSLQNRIYTAYGGTYVSIDCSADTIFKLDSTVYDFFFSGFSVWDSAGDKIFFGSYGWGNRGQVAVVDCETESVIDVIYSRVANPVVAVYNPRWRKLYVGSYDANRISVIDCVHHSVIKLLDYVMSQEPERHPAVYCEREDKIYWLIYGEEREELAVIDCATDSIIRKLPLDYAGNLCYSPFTNRLYISRQRFGSSTPELLVYDCHNDSLIDRLILHQVGLTGSMVYNPIDNKIYAGAGGKLVIFQEETHSIAENDGWKGVEKNNKQQTFIRNHLYIEAATQLPLLDITGRAVLTLKPGLNDVRGLSPGVYFISGNGSLRKVLLIR